MASQQADRAPPRRVGRYRESAFEEHLRERDVADRTHAVTVALRRGILSLLT
jgi:hypothetical protein